MPETETIHVSSDQLRISTHEVGRYAGGGRYKLDTRMKALASEVVEKAVELVAPLFTYAIHPVDCIDSQKGFRLKSGSYVEVPSEEKDPQTISLAAVVCTLGPDLEKESHQLMVNADTLTAMFLDAAGVAQLELLAHIARKYIKNKAAEVGLFTGCPFGPGYKNMPLESQTSLFKFVDAESIGVRLNPSGVMIPLKSISFWLRLTQSRQAVEDSGYKCQKCDMENCIYRKLPFKG